MVLAYGQVLVWVIAARSTTRRMSAQHKFELESVGLVLGGPAGAAPSDVQ